MVPLFMLAHFAHHLLNALPIPLLPFIRSDLALNYTQAGLLVSVFYVTYGICQLPAGWFADRTDRRLLVAVGICGAALAGFLVGISQTYVMIIVFLGFMGITGSTYHPSSLPLIAVSVEPQMLGRALGLHMIGGAAPFFVAPLIVAALAATWGWRSPFIVLAVPTMIFGIVFYILISKQAATKKYIQNTTNSRHKETLPTPDHPGRLRSLVSTIVLSGSTQAIRFSVVSFIPLFLVDHFGIGKETAAALIALFYSSGLWASFVGGFLADRFGRVPVLLGSCLMTGLSVYLLNEMPYPWGICPLLVISGIFVYISTVTTESHILSQTSEHNRSVIVGIYYSSIMEGGGILTPAMGYLIDHLGFYYSFTIAGAAIVTITLICSIWLRSSRAVSGNTSNI